MANPKQCQCFDFFFQLFWSVPEFLLIVVILYCPSIFRPSGTQTLNSYCKAIWSIIELLKVHIYCIYCYYAAFDFFAPQTPDRISSKLVPSKFQPVSQLELYEVLLNCSFLERKLKKTNKISVKSYFHNKLHNLIFSNIL